MHDEIILPRLCRPRGGTEVGEWPMLLDLVAAGVGVALVPEGLDFSLHARPAGALRLVPLAGVGLGRRVDLLLPKGHAASPAARRFAELVRQDRATAAEGE
ncbi:LysR family transcriptional regulator substrate-binding protein [Streptomyces sp. NPDC088354]|uniref:LysR family transcriptional regulator substrate-binding protein n=1 Tax=unclassified Streptomyces TaxID=2593676 RepID=UPI0029BA438C|nr:LysR family transcriptional regulator substrate-binding protein [Streptomyces sp. MI02-7b]MDX3076195.1 LysR family transcriptional regulator substrate-binding protein [Streptomyces sp. MI02-7b]